MGDALASSGVPKPWQPYQKEPSAVTPSCISGGSSPALTNLWGTSAVDEQYPHLSDDQGSIIHQHAVEENPKLHGQYYPSMQDHGQHFSRRLVPNMSQKESSMNPLSRSELNIPRPLDSPHQAHLHSQDTLFIAEPAVKDIFLKGIFSSDGSSYKDLGCESLGGVNDSLAIGMPSTSGTCPHAYPALKPDMYQSANNENFLSQAETISSLSPSFDFLDMPEAKPVLSNNLPLQATSFNAGKSSLQLQHDPQFSEHTVLPQSKFTPSNNSATWLPWLLDDGAQSWQSVHQPQWMTSTSSWGNNAGYYGDFWPTPEAFNINTVPVDSPVIQTYDVHSLPPSSLNRTLNPGPPLSPPTSEFNPDYSVTDPRHEYQTSSITTNPSSQAVPPKKELNPQDGHNNQTQPTSHAEEEKQGPQPGAGPGSIKASLHYSDTRNAFLIECKRRGLSYKEIKRIGGFKEAESTLRGRFRTLTKSKEQRVRKPRWQDKDIKLLCEAVAVCADAPNPHDSAARAQRNGNTHQPPKTSWKKVAHYIWNHGGSYQFGNATCKKKWCEIHDIKI